MIYMIQNEILILTEEHTIIFVDKTSEIIFQWGEAQKAAFKFPESIYSGIKEYIQTRIYTFYEAGIVDLNDRADMLQKVFDYNKEKKQEDEKEKLEKIKYEFTPMIPDEKNNDKEEPK